MPYNNEHAARLIQPDEFEKKTFRRVSGGSYILSGAGMINIPRSIDIIIGKLKTQLDDEITAQSLRFRTNVWSENDAIEWLENRNIEYISFESAEKKQNSMKRKNISLPVNYKAIGETKDINQKTRVVKGYFSSFDNIDSDFDIIRNGAFSKSIKDRGVSTSSNRKIKHLLNHNITEPAGLLLKLNEDTYGLYFESEIEKTPQGDITLERYKQGIYTEHSIGFAYVIDKCNFIELDVINKNGVKETIDVLECKELNLFEGSTLAFLGSNPETPFLGFKGNKDDMSLYLKDEFKFLMKHAPSFEYEYKLRQYYNRLYTLINNEIDVKQVIKSKDTIENEKPDIDYYKIIKLL